MSNKLRLILVAGGLAATVACGQKAPLYMPGVPKGASWPYPDPPRKLPPAERQTPAPPGTTDEKK